MHGMSTPRQKGKKLRKCFVDIHLAKWRISDMMINGILILTYITILRLVVGQLILRLVISTLVIVVKFVS